MTAEQIIDCHAHIIDPARFPFGSGRGHKPRPDESGTREEFCVTLDRHGVAGALLVQLSGYGTDNSAILDAAAHHPKRFKSIGFVGMETSERKLEEFSEAGMVGVRFNLVSYDPAALAHPAAPKFLGRMKTLGWFAQVFADDPQWPEIAPLLRKSGVRVLIDHFGVRDIARGIGQPGFQEVLRLGRERQAIVKLSAPFRVSRLRPDYADLDPFVQALMSAFGPEGLIWGSDWPFTNVADRPTYSDTMRPLRRWAPDAALRHRILWRNPAGLFGFTD